ncbi:hypothetical protein COB55_01650 [Candidatus Wolfebacteria bacterium]|nr:MAG: hypothetical protein COB55_01650 [Candidatus Wolfebacteria bacterium]
MNYDLAILGGGPAGVSAGVYASRKQLKTIFITKDYQSQSAVSEEVQNWIGTPKISGADLAKSFETHLKAYAGDIVEIKEGEMITTVTKVDGGFNIKTDKGEYTAKTVLISTGSHRRKLTVTGAEIFDNKGITYCATCDGPLFSGQDVVVIGGGNAGFETAAQLLAYTKSVTLFQRGSEYRADPVTVKKVLSHPNMTGLTNTRLVEIKGDKFVNELIYKIGDDGEETSIKTTGIFAEIGSVPTTGFVKDLVKLDEFNRIVVDPRNQRASVDGVWAAGDCTDGLYHQNNIAAGDAVKALEDIYQFIHAK